MRSMWLLVAALVPAAASAAEPLRWRWDPTEVRTYYVENEIVLPQPMWFLADRNKDARVISWQLKMLLRCDDIKPAGKHSWDVGCTVTDFGLRAAALEGDQWEEGRAPLVGPILEEVDAKMTGRQIRFTLRDDGRLGTMSIVGLPRTEQRIAQMNENLRLVIQRAIAGFDLLLPPIDSTDDMWGQRQSQLMNAPGGQGTMGGVQILSERSASGTEGRATVHSVGKGMLSPVGSRGEGTNTFSTKLDTLGTFDSRGYLVSREWVVGGEATSSSAISIGATGMPYLQRGRLVLLDGTTPAPDVGPTEEIGWPGQMPTSLTPWEPMGMGGVGPSLPSLPGSTNGPGSSW